MWRHTHNAQLDGQMIALCEVPGDNNALFYERDASEPSWRRQADGTIVRCSPDDAIWLLVEVGRRSEGQIHGI